MQWVPTYKNDSYQVGMWSTNDIKLISKENNAIITETELKNLGQKAAVYQANFGILLVSPIILLVNEKLICATHFLFNPFLCYVFNM